MDALDKVVTQVVPRLPPALSGVGDYASHLAACLRAAHAIETRFVVGDPDWKGSGDEGVRLAARSRRRMLETLPDREPVLLHYVGYGYAPRGCPFWLVRALEAWRKGKPGRRLIVMFHETAASRGPFPSSSFFNVPLQRWLFARLARLADVCHTNMRDYAGSITAVASKHRDRVVVHPVFSTVGEPQEISSLFARSGGVAIFGGGRWIREALTTHREALLRCAAAVGASKIVGLGAPGGIEAGLAISFEELGVLPAEEVSRVLAQSRAGFFSYPALHLGKSTIFAAYCAHGLVPVSALPSGENADGLCARRDYLCPDDLVGTVPLAELQTVADAAREWYAPHGLRASAAAFAASLCPGIQVEIR